MGWIPDYPDFRDYTEKTEEVKSVLETTRVLKARGLRGSMDLRQRSGWIPANSESSFTI
jgi:hypothetical protein